MEKHEAMNEILNDLVKINNDRITGYERAIKESKDLDIDLKAIFEEMIRQSTTYKEELTKYIQNDGGIAEDETTSSGKIYHAWMDIKSTFTDSDRHSILAACEFGEDAAQRAYEAALCSDALTEAAARKLVEDEQAALKKSHDMIKTARNAHRVFQK